MFGGRVRLDNIKPRFRLDKVKSHLRNSITLLFVPSRGGVARLRLPVYVCYLLLICFIAAGGFCYKFYANYQQLAQEAKEKEEIIQISNQEKRALEEENRQVKELAKQAEEVQNRLDQLAALSEKVQEKAFDNKLLPEKELAKLGWKRSNISSRSRGSSRQSRGITQIKESNLSEQLDLLARDISEMEVELRQLLQQLDRYEWLVERYPSLWPVRGRITSRFGYRVHPIRRRRLFHSGIDIAVSPGTSVKAAACGRVVYAGWRSGYGKTIIIDHGQGIRTLYAHNSRLHVKVGQWVNKGQVICASGNTGTSTGPHLHFEVLLNGQPKNPLDYLS